MAEGDPAAPDDGVGPVLVAGEATPAVVAAIRQLNEGVVVQDRGSYLRILVRGRCVLTRRTLEGLLGGPFHFPADLERLMPSFKGRFAVSEEEATWTFQGRP